MQICQKKIKQHLSVLKTSDKTVIMEPAKNIMMAVFFYFGGGGVHLGQSDHKWGWGLDQRDHTWEVRFFQDKGRIISTPPIWKFLAASLTMYCNNYNLIVKKYKLI